MLLAAIAAGAGVSPTIIGKPERPLLEQALRLMEYALMNEGRGDAFALAVAGVGAAMPA